MTVALTELRKGDKILIEATVTGRKTDNGNIIVQHKSLNEFMVYRDIDVEKISSYAVEAGDCVEWDTHGLSNPGWGVITHISDGYAWVRRYNDPIDRVTINTVFMRRKELPAGYENGKPTK